MNPSDLLPGGLSGEAALSLAAGFAAFFTVIALGRAFMPHDPMTARIKAHAQRRAQLRAGLIAAPRRKRQVRVSALRDLVERLKLTQNADSRKAAEQLAQAGWRSRDALVLFLCLRLVLPLVFGVLVWLLAAMIAGAKVTMLHQLIGAALGVALGAYGPVLGLKNKIKRRYARMQKGLPDALDLLVICAEAGLSLDGALTRVAREMGGAAPELADEFGLAAIELGFLPNRTEALRNLTRRVDLPGVRGVVNTLMQTERYGTPLAQSLRVLAAEFRDQRMMKAEEKAGRLPATLTVPMILFILPTLFIVLIGPALIQVLHTFRH
ncbi:MAG: type II secretion system F family protein [Alphaproteobacteria bacterium]|nr:type II secretion system F family protein [Alphaproteobacteria bacterium]